MTRQVSNCKEHKTDKCLSLQAANKMKSIYIYICICIVYIHTHYWYCHSKGRVAGKPVCHRYRSENSVPTPIVTSNLILMDLTFSALSSFPPFSQSCHSAGQQREGARESTLCQLSRVTFALLLFGSNGNKLAESSKCHESHKGHAQQKNKLALASVHFSHTHTRLRTHTSPFKL